MKVKKKKEKNKTLKGFSLITKIYLKNGIYYFYNNIIIKMIQLL